MSALRQYYDTHEKQILEEFFTFLRFASISSEKEHCEDIKACANWLQNYLKKMGFTTELWQTSGHPTLFASYNCKQPGRPTLLIYNHYDVQPVDPIEEWLNPPFEPTIKEGEVFARGAQDNKGQCFYVLQALKALIELEGDLPLNVKLCIEGEEEIGSPGLNALLEEKKQQLQADHLVIVDLGITAPDKPALNLGVRGILTLDLTVKGGTTDLHSGSHGGIAYNPLHALVEILSKLRDAQGRIAVPGFYDAVVELTEEEKAQFDLEFDEKLYKKQFGHAPTGGEQGLSHLERAWMRPTIEINGIQGGYTGEGFKTVIPKIAHAKLSCRLVPNQDPKTIGRLLSNFLKKNTPNGITLEVTLREGVGKAISTNPNAEVVHAFAKAYRTVFEKEKCSYILGGGSIPISVALQKASGGQWLGMGLGLGDDNIHAPNEHFGLDRLKKGTLIVAQALKNLS